MSFCASLRDTGLIIRALALTDKLIDLGIGDLLALTGSLRGIAVPGRIGPPNRIS